jgi:hypothetical protein
MSELLKEHRTVSTEAVVRVGEGRDYELVDDDTVASWRSSFPDDRRDGAVRVHPRAAPLSRGSASVGQIDVVRRAVNYDL